MSRSRKQQTQTAMAFRTHGGKRKGAGRPPKGKKSSERHDRRPAHDTRHPVHVTLRIVEADDQHALSKGVWGFEISAARHINRAIGERTGTLRRGSVFADRYHARALKSPREVRNAVRYALNNWLHHGEHRAPFARSWQIDPYATGIFFEGLEGARARDLVLPAAGGLRAAGGVASADLAAQDGLDEAPRDDLDARSAGRASVDGVDRRVTERPWTIRR